MIPVVAWNLLRTYGTYLTFPCAFAFGLVGYTLESWIRGNDSTTWKPKSISDERLERCLEEDKNKDLTQVERLKDKKFIPKTIFDRNQ